MATILSVSFPDEIVEPLDVEAARQRRSRSFVVSEAVSEYLARRSNSAFEAARDRTLREHLKLSPTERVRLAESLTDDATRGVPPRKPFSIGFDSYAEFDEWRRQGEPIPFESQKPKKTRPRKKTTPRK